MPRYHLNSATGEPGRCEAMVSCPYGDLESEHYDSPEAARRAYEGKQEASFPRQEGVAPLPAGVIVDSHTAAVAAGRYWFGDPCYALGADKSLWREWVAASAEASHDFQEPVSGASYRGFPVVAASTLYGDGTYSGSDGFSYPVDSGSLGVVPAALLEELQVEPNKSDTLGTWVDLQEKDLLSEENGVIRFGDILVSTGKEGVTP